MPAAPSDEISPTNFDDEAEPDYEFVPSPKKVPSWASKLKTKMKKLFCMEAKGQYRAHVAEKAARTRHMTMMRHLSQEIASGSEERVTNEETWISWHCKWSGSETE